MPAVSLIPHPATPCPAIRSLKVDCERPAPGRLALVYRLDGELDHLRIPAPSPSPGRRDRLWQQLCGEAFVREGAGPAYWEANFSPAGDWALYRFAAYRQGMTSPDGVCPPRIALTQTGGALELSVELALDALPADQEWLLAITAVVALREGGNRYWALRHPPGPPDFHHRDGFTLRLPA